MTQEESKVYEALQTFNKGIKSNKDAKTLIGNLGTDLSKIKPNDENLKKSLYEISEKLGECEKNFGRYKTTYVIGNENAPHYKIFKAVSSDTMIQTVKKNLKKKEISAIDSRANTFFNVEFPKGGKIGNKNTDEKLKKELAKFVVNLFYIFYPESCVTEKDLEKIKEEAAQKVPDVGNVLNNAFKPKDKKPKTKKLKLGIKNIAKKVGKVLGNAFKSKGKKQKSEKLINKKVETNKEENKNPKIEEPRIEEQKIEKPEIEKVEINKEENENLSNENSLISALNSFSSGVLNTVISNGQSPRSFDEVLSSCVDFVDKLFNNTANYEKENSDVKSVIEKIRKASEKFLDQKDVYKGRIYKNNSIPTLYRELTGKEVSAKDIALAKQGNIANEIEGLDRGSEFYNPVKDCLSAFMCIYAARDRKEFFDELYDSSSRKFLGQGGWGAVYSIDKRKSNKSEAVKEFEWDDGAIIGAESAHEVNAAFEAALDDARQIKRRMKSEGGDYKKNPGYKEAKGNFNRIALSKVVDGKLVSKRAECDLLNFIEEKFPKIIKNEIDKINDSNAEDREKKKKEYFENVEKGFTQLIEDMKTSVEQLHKANMCHRDIKPENFLVFSSKSKKSLLGYKCKLSDLDTKLNFGDKFEYKFSGTPYYTPPGFFSQTSYELMGSFCVEFGKGKAGCEVGRMLDLYALYKSMWQIARCIEEYSIGRLASELAAIADREANALYRDCKGFEMFDSLENMKKFLIDNGSNEKKDMDEYIGYYSHSYLEEDGTDNNKPNGNGSGNILKSRPNENGAGNIFKSRPNGNGAGNIFKSRPNENAGGNILKSRPPKNDD